VVELGAGTHIAHDATTEEIRVALGKLTAAPNFRGAAVAAAARIAGTGPIGRQFGRSRQLPEASARSKNVDR
jgi:hypothetical protein